MNIINYILSMILAFTMLIIIEMSTPVGSIIFEFEQYTKSAWIIQIILVLITIGIGLEIGQWVNNKIKSYSDKCE